MALKDTVCCPREPKIPSTLVVNLYNCTSRESHLLLLLTQASLSTRHKHTQQAHRGKTAIHTHEIFLKLNVTQLLRGSVLHRSFPTVTELKAPLSPSTALLILVLSGLTCRERPCMCVPATPQHLVPWTVPDGRNGRPCSPPHTP